MTCPSCEGGRIWRTGIRPGRHTRGDMTEPDTWLDWCPRCSGTGVIDEDDDQPDHDCQYDDGGDDRDLYQEWVDDQMTGEIE